ncbi:hypothetical protein GGI35DRAFT_470220 [Trichoderma velutinum]
MRSTDKRQKPANARKACLRCRRAKRKCDRALPKCLLCMRRQEDCQYETITLSSSGSVTSLTTNPTISPDEAISPQRIKAAIVGKLLEIEPKDVVLAYHRTMRPWFPLIAESKLGDQLPGDWDDASLDFTLLCSTIMLVCTTPESSTWMYSNVSILKDLYLSTKSWIALLEGIGVNSTEVVQSRLFVTLFEVTQGLYPAAYISISGVVRAAEMLKRGRDLETGSSEPASEEERVEGCMTWAAIKIMDRYIAIENGEYPPVTRRVHTNEPDLPYSELPFAVCPVFRSTPFSPQRQFLRLYEATNLLNQVHVTIYEPTPRISFNFEEKVLLVNTLTSLRAVILGEVPDDSRIYSPGLLVYRLPPFVYFLMYKAAKILTNSTRDQTNFNVNIQILKSLRDFLDLIQTRWLAAGRYLGLLDEDTTPRIFKALGRERLEDESSVS